MQSSRKIQLGPGKQRGKTWLGFEKERKYAKLSMTTFTYRSSYLFYVWVRPMSICALTVLLLNYFMFANQYKPLLTNRL
jgi:hypothetical protein